MGWFLGLGIAVLVVLLGLVVITRYKVVGPSEAFIITGRRGKQATDPDTGRVFTDNSGQKEKAEASLSGQGLVLDAFQIQDVTTEGSYLEDLGRPEAARAEQEAEAAAIAAKGSAEAEAMQKKADAFAPYGDAAVLQMLVEVLPQVVAKASEPLSAVDKMTVISTDGASQLTRTVTDNVAQGMELLSSTTGVGLAQLLQSVTQKKPAPSSAVPSDDGSIEITD